MTSTLHLAHLRPTEIRALVVRDGVPSEARVGTTAAALQAIIGGSYSFLLLMGGTEGRGVVLVAAVGALHRIAEMKSAPTAAAIAQALGTTVAVGPAKLRDGTTAWTSLTDGEVEFWSVALAAPPAPKKKRTRKTKGGTP